MKSIILLGLIVLSGSVIAQTKIERTIPAQTGQKLEFNFDYPELIKIQTWDRKEVMIKGEVSINKGENDDAFELITSTKNNIVTVTSELKDKDNLPKRIVIKKGDMEYVFKAKDYKDPEVKKFMEEHGGNYTYMSSGIIREIKLEIFVPVGIETSVEAKYGIVEVLGFNAPLTVDATYGGVDATINSRATGELIARTHFGEILTNLDLSFASSKEGDANSKSGRRYL